MAGPTPDPDLAPDPAEALAFSGGKDQAEPELPRLGARGWARWVWRQLTSMRTALLLLLLLAVAAVPGSLFPQRRVDPSRVTGYLREHPDTGPWLDRFGFLDVYSSPWFSAVYLLLFISLIGCVLPRIRHHARDLRNPPPRTPRRLERLPEHRECTTDRTPAEVLALARPLLARRRYRIADEDDGTGLAAERGYLAETGNLVFHLALVALLISVAAGSFTGYSGQVLVVEGDRFANVMPAYNTFTPGRRTGPGDLEPFTFTLDTLKVAFEAQSAGQLGAARAFDATVTVAPSPGAAPRTQLVQVNRPLTVGDTRVFLSGNGYAPLVTVRDGAGNVAFTGAVPALSTDRNYTSSLVVKVPDAQPRQLGLVGTFLPSAVLTSDQGWVSIFPDAVNPRLVLTAFAAPPGTDGLGAQDSVYVLDVAGLTQLRSTDNQAARLLLEPGATVQLPEGAGSITFDGLRRYAAFDVRSDPTKGWVLGSALVALAGVTASLFVRRRRLWLRVSVQDDGRTRVQVAGLSRGEDPGLGVDVQSLLAGCTPEKE